MDTSAMLEMLLFDIAWLKAIVALLVVLLVITFGIALYALGYVEDGNKQRSRRDNRRDLNN